MDGTQAGLFQDLAGFEAAGADPDSLRLAVHPGVNRLQVDVETPLPDVVRVADGIAESRFLAAYFASLSHRSSKIASIY